jgi:hypothetical protein
VGGEVDRFLLRQLTCFEHDFVPDYFAVSKYIDTPSSRQQSCYQLKPETARTFEVLVANSAAKALPADLCAEPKK